MRRGAAWRRFFLSFFPFLFVRLSISVCFKLAGSIFAYLNRCLAREWSSRWCALGPPTPSATGAVRRRSTGGNGADDGDVDVGVDVDLVADVNLDQTILLTITRVWVRGDQLTKVATKFGGPGYRPPRQQSFFSDMLIFLAFLRVSFSVLVFFKLDYILRNFSLVVGIRSEETRDQILRNSLGGSTKEEEVVKKEEEEEKEEKRGVGKKRVPKNEPETKKENKK